MAETPTERVRRLYDRHAASYGAVERSVSQQTCNRAVSLASGRVLEIGVGTGRNIPHYPNSCQITGIDLSSRMLVKARDRARERERLTGLPVRLLIMDAEHMDFSDSGFDTVVATFVF